MNHLQIIFLANFSQFFVRHQQRREWQKTALIGWSERILAHDWLSDERLCGCPRECSVVIKRRNFASVSFCVGRNMFLTGRACIGCMAYGQMYMYKPHILHVERERDWSRARSLGQFLVIYSAMALAQQMFKLKMRSRTTERKKGKK